MSYLSYWCADCEILDLTEAQAKDHARVAHRVNGRWRLARRVRRMRLIVRGSFTS